MTLLPIIAAGVKKFADVVHEFKGVPTSVIEEVQQSGQYTAGDVINVANKLWHDRLYFIHDALTAEEPLYFGPYPKDAVEYAAHNDRVKQWAENRQLALDYFSLYLIDMWW